MRLSRPPKFCIVRPQRGLTPYHAQRAKRLSAGEVHMPLKTDTVEEPNLNLTPMIDMVAAILSPAKR